MRNLILAAVIAIGVATPTPAEPIVVQQQQQSCWGFPPLCGPGDKAVCVCGWNGCRYVCP